MVLGVRRNREVILRVYEFNASLEVEPFWLIEYATFSIKKAAQFYTVPPFLENEGVVLNGRI